MRKNVRKRLVGVLSVLLGCTALLSACERPFIDADTPTITVVDPNFATVFVSPNVTIRVEASSFRDVRSVAIDGDPMTFVPELNQWVDTLQMQRGLNTFILTAQDVDGVEGRDTVQAVFMPFQVTAFGPELPEPRGGHAATLLSDGSLLVTGGATRADGSAQADAYLLRPGDDAFTRLNNGLNEARTGHTATLLPDDRVLIMGGSHTDGVDGVMDLVESVELYDPDRRTFEPLVFEGQPIRRALHTASTRGTLIDLYGGRGDIRYTPDPRLGTRRDLRTFRFVGDSLVALNALQSAPFLDDAIAGHTQTPLVPVVPGVPGRFLIVGSFFADQTTDDVSFQLDFTDPPEIFLDDAPPPIRSRTRHAATTLREGFILLFGGTQFNAADALSETELYVEDADRFFRFPGTPRPLKRYGLTATKLPSGRILLVGGFSTAGNSLTVSEFFDANGPN